MSIDIVALFEKNRIDYKTHGLEVTRGWVNTKCPFCGDSKTHLGYSSKLDLFSCWKCGVKSRDYALSKILNVSIKAAKAISKDYFIEGSVDSTERREYAKELVLPRNEGCLLKQHKQYLKRRGFDYLALERDYGLVGTGDYSDKKFGDFSNRILIPIYYKGKLVSFHSRHIYDDGPKAKKACPKEFEVISHKNLIYGFDSIPGNTIILSEGPFDKFRWNKEGGATLGIKFTEHQVDMLRCFRNIFIVFDSEINEYGDEEEEIAQKQAERLAEKLSIWNNVWVLSELGSDPGAMTQARANRIKRKIEKIVEKCEK